MGLKNTLAKAIVRTTVRTIIANRKVEDSKITTQNKKGKISPAYDYMLHSSKKCFILEACSFDMCSLNEYRGEKSLKYSDYFGIYKIFDKNEELKFLLLEKCRGAGKEFIGKNLDRLFLFDLHETVLGSIKEHIFSTKAPIIEDDAKTCSVILDQRKLCNVKRVYTFGKECFEISDGYKLEHIKNTDFTITKGGKRIATTKIFRPNLKDVFPRSIVVEYDDSKQDKTALLLAMAIDAVCSY